MPEIPEGLDADAVLARNPRLDRAQIEKVMELAQRLRRQGLQGKGYELAPPFGGRRAIPKDKIRPEARLLRVR